MKTSTKKTTAAKKTAVETAPKATPVREHVADFNNAFFLRKEDNERPAWRRIDAKGRVLGRLATEVADILRGKDRAIFTPHTDSGDYVVIVNASKVVLTGNKLTQKEYAHYTGWIGGLKTKKAGEILAKHPDRLISLAVKGMLPKNKLSRQLLRKLRIFPGAEHSHSAQIKSEE